MKNNSLSGLSLGLALLLGACGGGDDGESDPGTGTGIGENFTSGETGASSPILGSWDFTNGEGGASYFSFFDDGTYVHVRQGNSAFDEQGLEWGDYSRRGSDGLLSAKTRFDENEGTGLSGDASGSATLTANPSGNDLIIAFTDNQGSGQVTLSKLSADGIVGTWRTTDISTTQLNMLSFLPDMTYLHAQVDNVTTSSTSGAEKGVYTHDDTTGEISVTSMLFDTNAEAGLSGYSSPVRLFVNVAGNMLTLSVDTDGNGESDEDINYTRE